MWRAPENAGNIYIVQIGTFLSYPITQGRKVSTIDSLCLYLFFKNRDSSTMNNYINANGEGRNQDVGGDQNNQVRR
jgi:hypothetical protein